MSFIDANKKLYLDLFESYYSHMSPYNTGISDIDFVVCQSFASGSVSEESESPADVHISLEYSHLTHVVRVHFVISNIKLFFI